MTSRRFRILDPAAFTRPRALLAAGSVATVAAVVFMALPAVHPGAQRWILASGILAVIATVQTVASDPRDLKTAMLLALPAPAALAVTGAAAWLVGPLAVLLLVAAELSTLSWECQDAERLTTVQRGRLWSVAGIAALALVASLTLALAAPGLTGG